MPVKDMVYDALQFAAQVEQAAKSHRNEKKNIPQEVRKSKKKLNSGEYLSGFYKEDRLLPVITLAVYFGADQWDGPVCLHEMLKITDEKMLCFIPDYRINLITPEGLEENQFDQFHTSLREVLKFIKYSKDKEKLYHMVENDPKFHKIGQKAGRVINVITGAGIEMDESEEYVDMCQAIRDIKEEAKQEGKQREKEEIILRMLRKGILTYEEIAEIVDDTVDKVKAIGTQSEN